jgi:hypothetical protein
MPIATNCDGGCRNNTMKPFCIIFSGAPIHRARSAPCRELPPPAPGSCLDLLLQCCYTQRTSWCVLVRDSGRCSDLTLTWRRCSIARIHSVTMQVYAESREPLEIIGLASTPSVGTI